MDMIDYGIVSTIAGVILFILSFGVKKLYYTISNLPTSKIRSIAMGLVELYGEVVPNYTKSIKTPFSNEHCVYSKWEVSRWVSDKHGGYYKTIKKGNVMDYFYLNDGTGHVLVDANFADVSIPRSYAFKCNKPPEHLIQFLGENKIKMKNIFGFYHFLKFEEYSLFPKNKVFILGTATDNPFVVDGFAKHNFEDIMISKGKKKSVFYITNNNEKSILGELKFQLYFLQYGGITFILIGLWLIFGSLDLF